ncbi:Lactobacillus up-regulated protein [Lasiodiplodia hormozganensis]|uniref:Lactobacillus up-regulated protein n=1 Tax=Lasiodiplodia hormozganensis TaxID=869390 RepID=A0AA39Z0A5_9PEZI|nr:Lactobacillus up-regulated protein [Lasiodiplodia hormozganensis]
MELCHVLAATLLASFTGAVPTAATNPLDIIRALKIDDDGFVHTGDDGVTRSYNANNEVIDYYQTDPQQLEMLVNFWPIVTDKDHLRQIFNGVDGRVVVNEDTLLHPPEELRPAAIPAPGSSSIDPALLEKRDVV